MSAPTCPICGEPRSQEFRPFCSKRCADIDLGRWARGVYALPAAEEEPPSEEQLLRARAQEDEDLRE